LRGASDRSLNNATLQRAWAAVLRSLAGKISTASFEAYIRPVKPLSLDGDQVVLGVASKFAADWIRKNYLRVIQASLESALARNLHVQLKVTAADSLPLFSDAPAAPATAVVPEPAAWNPSIPLYGRFTFDNFVVGKSNRLAQAAAQSVAESPGVLYNPLFLYGESGRGKTHLLHAIGQAARTLPDKPRVVLIDGEGFARLFVEAVRDRRLEEFRRHCAGIDVWLVDDVQFIAEKDRNSEEFLHTFNALYRSGKQIVLASDRGPRELHTLDDRIRSRFESGLVAQLGPPEIETRMAILDRRAREMDFRIPMEAVYFLANGVRSNVRALEGALTTFMGYCRLTGAEPTVEAARAALGDQLLESPAVRFRKAVPAETVLEAAADYFGFTPEALRGPSRAGDLVRARQATMYLMRKLSERTYTEIGQILGGRDHAPVHRGIQKIDRLLDADPHLQIAMQELQDRLTH
jgi:chromosomal replication initiator protein